MSNEIRVQTSLQIRKVDATTGLTVLDYGSRPTSFNASMTGSKGPTPGALTATIYGVLVSLAELSLLGGWCRLMNKDPTNFVTVGLWDGLRFHPLLELLPGESYPLRLSRELGSEYPGTGTEVVGSSDQLMIRSYNQPCEVLVEAFDA